LSRGNYKYPLEEILFLALASAISGLCYFDEMEEFGELQIDWFRKYFPYKNGIPSHDTINRLFAAMDPKEFCSCFTAWVQSIRKDVDREVIAIDGKAIKGSAQPSKGIKSLQFVSAYAAQNSLVLCQEVVDGKSNEMTAVPKLIDLIDCKGAIITVDALNCQVDIATKILEKKADYLLALKSNHRGLYEQVKTRFERQEPVQIHSTENVDHGRVEKRICSLISDLKWIDDAENWPLLKTVIKIESSRYHKATGKTDTQTRYYISSLHADAELINKSVRLHWSIENKLHWMLDVSFKEDASRKRKDHSTENYALISKMALNLIKQDTTKGPYSRKKFRSLINPTVREQLMGLV
jgi:predicted transposase YbfD/YdcC